jgi:hypothetical protein
VFPVEDPRYEQAAEPTQLPFWFGFENGRLEAHPAAAGRLDPHFELGPANCLAADVADERIPFGVRVEVGQDLPDAGWRRFDLDRGA